MLLRPCEKLWYAIDSLIADGIADIPVRLSRTVLFSEVGSDEGPSLMVMVSMTPSLSPATHPEDGGAGLGVSLSSPACFD